MAEKAKGIRVNELAKELGVDSKSILAKLRDEQIPGAPTNHQGRISLGLAASAREWFEYSGGGTAVEARCPSVLPAKPKRPTKKKADDEEEGAASGAPIVEAEIPKQHAPHAKSAEPVEAPPSEPEVPTVSPPAVAPMTAISAAECSADHHQARAAGRSNNAAAACTGPNCACCHCVSRGCPDRTSRAGNSGGASCAPCAWSASLRIRIQPVAAEAARNDHACESIQYFADRTQTGHSRAAIIATQARGNPRPQAHPRGKTGSCRGASTARSAHQ